MLPIAKVFFVVFLSTLTVVLFCATVQAVVDTAKAVAACH